MGNGALLKTRYIGGKQLRKYFLEDVLVTIQNYMGIFAMAEETAFTIFRAFALCDTKDRGLVSNSELFRYIGGKPNKFTERIFYSEPFMDEDGFKQSGLVFKRFFLLLWNYCTLNHHGLAGYMYEIFDVDAEDSLERGHLIAMWRMLNDYDAYEEESIALYGLQEGGIDGISKARFCEVSAGNALLIQPAVDFQAKLRRAIGGRSSWVSMTNHRYRSFRAIIARSPNLNAFLESMIVEAREYGLRWSEPDADSQLMASHAKLQIDNELADRELQLLNQQMQQEQMRLAAEAPDRAMRAAWAAFEQARTAFMVEEYTTEEGEAERRHRDRSALFELYDKAFAESATYWDYKDSRDRATAEGSDADHEMRYRDHVKIPENTLLQEVLGFVKTLELVLGKILEKVHSKELKAKTTGKGKEKEKKRKKSEKEAFVESQLQSLQSLLAHIDEEGLLDIERTKRYQSFYQRDFSEERKFVSAYASKEEIELGGRAAYAALSARLRETFIRDEFLKIEAAKEERRKDFIRREFEVITQCGSRGTQWEYLLDKDENLMTYVHRETGQRRHPKTAICEQCDSILIQHEKTCSSCDAMRSTKNWKLFRPLGFKDITLE